MHKACVTSDEILDIYLQVARAAFKSSDKSISKKMLRAAHGNAKLLSQKVSTEPLASLAELLLLSQEVHMAEEIYNLAMSSLKRSEPCHRWLLARICDGLSEIYAVRSEHAKARKACQRTVSILEATPAVDPKLLASRLKKLAWIHVQDGRERSAAELLERYVHLAEGC